MTVISAYQSLIQLIRDGDNVDAATINRVLRELAGNADYLKDIFEQAALGSAVFARGVSVEADALVGQPVWYNPSSQQFERALAGATIEGGQLVTTPASQVWGLVYQKLNATLADLILAGYAEVDLTNSVPGGVSAGVYYLSAATPGELTLTRPPLGVPVLLATGDGKVHVRPGLADLFTSHKHYLFELACRPAGIANLAGGTWSVDTPDDSVEGWLPAGHASFAGKAPFGAAFGYNLAASDLASAWPPLPLNSVCLEWSKAASKDVGYTGVPLGADGLAVLNAHGIWWMSDCEDDVPWPASFDGPPGTTTTTTTTPAPLECPRDLFMQMRLWFSKMTFQTADTAVTSLRIAEDSQAILTLTCLQTDEEGKTAGDLVLAIDLNMAVDADDDEPGYLAIKRFEDNTLYRGPVVESIRTDSSSVLLTGDLEESGKFYGNVKIDVASQAVGAELPISSIRLDGTTEENFEDTLALGFPADYASEYRAEFKIPDDLGAATAVTLKLRFWLLGLVAGDLPSLELSYRRYPRPTGGAAVALPTADTALTLDTAAAPTLAAEEYVELDSEAFAAAPGDVIMFTLRRPADDDGYLGEVHMVRQHPVITGVS